MTTVTEHTLIQQLARRSTKTRWLVFHSEIIVLGQHISSSMSTANIYLNLITSHAHHPQPCKQILYLAQDYLWHQLPLDSREQQTWIHWWQNKQHTPPGQSDLIGAQLSHMDRSSRTISALYLCQHQENVLCLD